MFISSILTSSIISFDYFFYSKSYKEIKLILSFFLIYFFTSQTLYYIYLHMGPCSSINSGASSVEAEQSKAEQLVAPASSTWQMSSSNEIHDIEVITAQNFAAADDTIACGRLRRQKNFKDFFPPHLFRKVSVD